LGIFLGREEMERGGSAIFERLSEVFGEGRGGCEGARFSGEMEHGLRQGTTAKSESESESSNSVEVGKLKRLFICFKPLLNPNSLFSHLHI